MEAGLMPYLVRFPLWDHSAQFSAFEVAMHHIEEYRKVGGPWELYAQDEGAWKLIETGDDT